MYGMYAFFRSTKRLMSREAILALVFCFAVLGFLASPVLAAVLNHEASFEEPELEDGTEMTSSTFESWEVNATVGSPPVLVRRGAAAYRGGQFIEIQADGSSANTQSLRQELAVVFQSSMRLMLSVRLRAVGQAPATGNLVLRVITGSDEEVEASSVPYAQLSDRWVQFTLWPAVPDDPGQVGETIGIEIIAGSMGTNPSFSIYVDNVLVETVEDDASAFAPNHSFESADLKALGLDSGPAYDHLTDWYTTGAHKSLLTVETDGGSHGPQYLSAATRSSGSYGYPMDLLELDGSYLDTANRYELSGDAR